MLLHLQPATSLGAEGVHCSVAAHPLDVGGLRVVGRDVDGGIVVRGGTGGVHLVGVAHERAGVGLVGLAAVGVRGLVDGQDGRVAGRLAGGRLAFRLGGVDGFGGLVKGHRRRGRVEGTQAFRELLDGDLHVGHVHSVRVTTLHVEAAHGSFLLGVEGRVLHGVDGRGQSEHDIVRFVFRRSLRGEYGIEGVGRRGRRDGGRDGDGPVDRKERRNVDICTMNVLEKFSWRCELRDGRKGKVLLRGESIGTLTMWLEMLSRRNARQSREGCMLV